MGYSDLLEKPGRLMLKEENRQTYQWVQNNGRGYLQLPVLDHPDVFHLFGTRLLKPTEIQHRYAPILLSQVHGDQVLRLTDPSSSPQIEALEGDALVTDIANRFIAIGTADCTPILLFDPVRKVSAAIHAGWRGSVLDISGKAVRKMLTDYGSQPKNLYAGIGPTISTCCFEVGPDVAEAVNGNTPYGDLVLHQKKEQKTKKWQLDLVKLNRLQLIDAGLPINQIEAAGLCTSCLPNLFYSFRRDREKTGNMVSGIMLL